MNSLKKNLQEKNYNPCGNLTGREIDICDIARKSYNITFNNLTDELLKFIMAYAEGDF